MGIGPVAATEKALKRAGITVDDLDIIEAERGLRRRRRMACARELELDGAKVNLDGGAIALGHPLGATGARITGKAAALLKREGKAVRALDAVHRRRPGHRHGPGGGLMDDIAQSAAVIGAGVMGGGIAAQIANAGMPVVLLDIVAEGREPTAAPSPKARSSGCSRPTRRPHAQGQRRGWSRPARSRTISTLLADVDWIVEAVVEDRDVKRDALSQARHGARSRARSSPPTPRPFRWRTLIEGMPERFRAGLPHHPFLQSAALHAPAGSGRRPRDAARSRRRDQPTSPTQRSARAWSLAKDTPGLHRQPHRRLLDAGGGREALDLGLTVEEADAVMGRPIGVPEDRRLRPARSGRARPACRMSMRAWRQRCRADDAYHAIRRDLPLMHQA